MEMKRLPVSVNIAHNEGDLMTVFFMFGDPYRPLEVTYDLSVFPQARKLLYDGKETMITVHSNILGSLRIPQI